MSRLLFLAFESAAPEPPVVSAVPGFATRVEAMFTVPSGSATVSATNAGGGPTSVLIPGGDYFLSSLTSVDSLLETFAAQLNTSRPPATGQWAVELGADGRVTISCGEPASITWTNTTLRDLLGFGGNFTNQTSITGTKQARCLWYPNCPAFLPSSDPRLAPRGTDARSSVQQDGHVITFASGVSMRKHMGLRWSHVPLDRIREQSATYANASWRKFWDDTQLGLGELPWCQPGSPLVIVDHNGVVLGQDMQDGGPTYGWQVLDPGNIEPQRVNENGWDGHWLVEIPTLVARDE